MSNFISKVKKAVQIGIIKTLNLLPIKNNKVFIYSYYGSQYGCSPKYISQYLVENYSDKFDVVWAFNDIASKKDIKGIRKVKVMSLKYFYELCTSKVIITNFRTTDLFIKRKGQYYVQTWHSSLRLKQIEKDAEESLPTHYVEMAKEDSKKLDLLLSGCKFSTDIFKRAFWYDGEIFEQGTPRNDILFKDNSKLNKRIKDGLNIPKEKKIILYAPTFRKGDSLEVYNINYERTIKALEDRFGGEWVFLVKLHPHLIARSKELVHGKNVIDVTSYDDIQELLSVTDVLVSDYSSLMFDFALTERPCFLYVPDLEDYTKNDRGLYFNINELPFITTLNNEEVDGKIRNFNENEYKYNLKKFSKSIGTFEKGRTSEELAKHLEKICFK